MDSNERAGDLALKASTLELRIQRLEREIEFLRTQLTEAKASSSDLAPQIEAAIERRRLKVIDNKERYAKLRDWLTNPEHDQLLQPPPKPRGQVLQPEGIASKEAHSAS